MLKVLLYMYLIHYVLRCFGFILCDNIALFLCMSMVKFDFR